MPTNLPIPGQYITPLVERLHLCGQPVYFGKSTMAVISLATRHIKPLQTGSGEVIVSFVA